MTVKNILDNEKMRYWKDKLYLFLACAAAITASACMYIAYIAIKAGAIGIASLFTAALLIFIWPLLVSFLIKYTQRYESLKWFRDLAGTDKDGSPKINFIPI
jgi:FtsH-binding integral membrane protein